MSKNECEAVEVVGYRSARNGLVDEDAHVLHEAEPLMTVAQHERIVAATVQSQCSEVLKAANEQLAAKDAEIARLRHGIRGDYDLDTRLDWAKEAEALRAQITAQQGVVMPERQPFGDFRKTWNQCLDEFARLNGDKRHD